MERRRGSLWDWIVGTDLTVMDRLDGLVLWAHESHGVRRAWILRVGYLLVIGGIAAKYALEHDPYPWAPCLMMAFVAWMDEQGNRLPTRVANARILVMRFSRRGLGFRLLFWGFLLTEPLLWIGKTLPQIVASGALQAVWWTVFMLGYTFFPVDPPGRKKPAPKLAVPVWGTLSMVPARAR